MKIRGENILVRATRKHANLRLPAKRWKRCVIQAQWQSPEDLREQFPSVNYVKGLNGYIFNLGGNNFRLLARIDFRDQTIRIKRVGTHDEYDKW